MSKLRYQGTFNKPGIAVSPRTECTAENMQSCSYRHGTVTDLSQIATFHQVGHHTSKVCFFCDDISNLKPIVRLNHTHQVGNGGETATNRRVQFLNSEHDIKYLHVTNM